MLVIPTLFGMMLINFALTQFMPGGPIEQVSLRLQGEGDAGAALTGGGPRWWAKTMNRAADTSAPAACRGIPGPA